MSATPNKTIECVLLVGNFPSATAPIRNVCEDLARRLGFTGWRVLTTSHQGGRIPRLLDMVSTIWNQRKHYSVAQVDVFSGKGFMLAEAACYTLRLARKPIVLTLRGGNLPRFASRWSRRVRRLLQSADAVVAPSRYLQEEMRYYRSDIQLIPNPISISDHSFRLRDQPAPRLVWVRSFHRIYNPTLGPEVVAMLTSEYPNLHLTMLGADRGDGSLMETRRQAHALGVADKVFMPGRVRNTEVPQWLARGDIFLNTTNVDNTPVSVLEAMACGLCIVSTNVGGTRYILKHGEDALLVPPDDAAAMAAAVRRILTQPELAARISLRAREKACGFDWSDVVPQWDRLLKSLVPVPQQGMPNKRLSSAPS